MGSPSARGRRGVGEGVHRGFAASKPMFGAPFMGRFGCLLRAVECHSAVAQGDEAVARDDEVVE